MSAQREMSVTEPGKFYVRRGPNFLKLCVILVSIPLSSKIRAFCISAAVSLFGAWELGLQ